MLPPDTERVWDFLRTQPALAGFVLVGGSALALRINHRLSEDLDLVWQEIRLPRSRLEAMRRAAASAAVDFQLYEDEVAAHEFLDSGLELHDYQQNYLVNQKVKVSLFAPEAPMLRVLERRSETGVRVATLTELFKTKCLVSAQRSKTRDWLDLYLLLRHHGFTLRDYLGAFAEAGLTSQFDIGLSRLCSGVPQKDDEGYANLLNDPPSLEAMKGFFIEQRDRLEVERAEEAARQRQMRPSRT